MIVNGKQEMQRLADSGHTDQATASARLAICRTCPELKAQYIGGEYNPETQDYGVWTDKQLCDQCGCIMPWKVTFVAADCPLNKW